MAESGQFLSQDELLQAHRKERKDLQGVAGSRWQQQQQQQYQLSAQQFEARFRRLQSVPFPANNIISLHLHEFLANCSLRHGLAEDALLLCLATCAAHLMGLSASTAVHLSRVWRERPTLWSTILVPQAHTCHNFAWTLQSALSDLHCDILAQSSDVKPVVVDELEQASLLNILQVQESPVAAVHSSLEPVRSLYRSVGRTRFDKLALGTPVLWQPGKGGEPCLSHVLYNMCCVTEPTGFHAIVSSRLSEDNDFEECLWSNLLLSCCQEKVVDLSAPEEANSTESGTDKLRALLSAVAEVHRQPVAYRLSAEAKSVLPQLLSKFKRLASSWSCRVALFKAATSQILRLAAALYVLDGCLSTTVHPQVHEYEIPAAHVWEAHDIVMHSLRLKAELLECPLRDDAFRTVPSDGSVPHRNSSSTMHGNTNGTSMGSLISSMLHIQPEQQQQQQQHQQQHIQVDQEQLLMPVQQLPIPRELSVSLVQSPARENEVPTMFNSLLHEPQESFLSLSSIIPDSEEEFMDKFRYKIRRLLICGKSLLTPTLVAQMKYVSVMDPNVPGKPRYPTQVAALFLERVAALGFGTMLTRHDSHSKKLLFRKTEYQHLGPAQLEILQNLRVTRDQYALGCQRQRATSYWESGSGTPVSFPLSPVCPPGLQVKQEVIDLN